MEEKIKKLIYEIPKAELHCHIDCVSPELLLRFGKRNKVHLPVSTLEEAKKLYQYKDLDEFLEVWLLAMSVIRTEEDYTELVLDCAKEAKKQNIIYREGMFTYTAAHGSRGISLDTVINGFSVGREEALKQYGVDICFIAEIDRTTSSEDSVKFVHEIAGYRDKLPIAAIGLDMQEKGYPAHNHQKAFQLAREYGFMTTAHAFEEGPAQIWDTLDSLEVKRIDHGSQSIEDEKLIQYLVENKIILTLCPDSDINLGVHHLEDYPAKDLLNKGVIVTINSDDPSFFPANLIDNFTNIADYFNLTEEEIITMVRNAFQFSFCGSKYLNQLENWLAQWKGK